MRNDVLLIIKAIDLYFLWAIFVKAADGTSPIQRVSVSSDGRLAQFPIATSLADADGESIVRKTEISSDDQLEKSVNVKALDGENLMRNAYFANDGRLEPVRHQGMPVVRGPSQRILVSSDGRFEHMPSATSDADGESPIKHVRYQGMPLVRQHGVRIERDEVTKHSFVLSADESGKGESAEGVVEASVVPIASRSEYPNKSEHYAEVGDYRKKMEASQLHALPIVLCFAKASKFAAFVGHRRVDMVGLLYPLILLVLVFTLGAFAFYKVREQALISSQSDAAAVHAHLRSKVISSRSRDLAEGSTLAVAKESNAATLTTEESNPAAILASEDHVRKNVSHTDSYRNRRIHLFADEGAGPPPKKSDGSCSTRTRPWDGTITIETADDDVVETKYSNSSYRNRARPPMDGDAAQNMTPKSSYRNRARPAADGSRFPVALEGDAGAGCTGVSESPKRSYRNRARPPPDTSTNLAESDGDAGVEACPTKPPLVVMQEGLQAAASSATADDDSGGSGQTIASDVTKKTSSYRGRVRPPVDQNTAPALDDDAGQNISQKSSYRSRIRPPLDGNTTPATSEDAAGQLPQSYEGSEFPAASDDDTGVNKVPSKSYRAVRESREAAQASNRSAAPGDNVGECGQSSATDAHYPKDEGTSLADEGADEGAYDDVGKNGQIVASDAKMMQISNSLPDADDNPYNKIHDYSDTGARNDDSIKLGIDEQSVSAQ